MIPYKDDNPTRTFPFVTLGIIALNVIVFLWELTSPAGEQNIALSYGAIPHNLFTFENNRPLHPVVTIFSSMFLHGGLFHLGGNMLYLWIFGDNIEDELGHFRYFIFYLLSGVAAAYAHALSSPSSTTPMIGASGAISGVLGAYLFLFPRARVNTLLFFGFFWQVVKIPALIVIGFWAMIQIINGILSGGVAGRGGVAWFAHVGGFLFGLVSIRLWLSGRRNYRWS